MSFFYFFFTIILSLNIKATETELDSVGHVCYVYYDVVAETTRFLRELGNERFFCHGLQFDNSGRSKLDQLNKDLKKYEGFNATPDLLSADQILCVTCERKGNPISPFLSFVFIPYLSLESSLPGCRCRIYDTATMGETDVLDPDFSQVLFTKYNPKLQENWRNRFGSLPQPPQTPPLQLDSTSSLTNQQNRENSSTLSSFRKAVCSPLGIAGIVIVGVIAIGTLSYFVGPYLYKKYQTKTFIKKVTAKKALQPLRTTKL